MCARPQVERIAGVSKYAHGSISYSTQWLNAKANVTSGFQCDENLSLASLKRLRSEFRKKTLLEMQRQTEI